jgi:hypothetical protein
MKKLSKTQQVKLFRELWEWLSENPTKEKTEWPRWNINFGDIQLCANQCPLCAWVIDIHGSLKDCNIHCPIKWPTEDNSCSNGGPFSEWCRTTTDDDEKIGYAKQIAKLPLKK